MPNPQKIVINTSPLIALIAAVNDLTILQSLYSEVHVPLEVCQEILAGGKIILLLQNFKLILGYKNHHLC
ncbi:MULTISPECIES: hypothetical protein [unclassified Okeania]|uniref:hypothetical protein n=1 Tax=unclassified Okeania TaxID=2634635 RepID=UPI00257EF490|nr:MULTISPECIES: hypothetical protein [unclassified Okeania]